MSFRFPIFFLLCLCTLFTVPAWADLPLEKIELPPGFKISIYAENVNGARSLARSPSGTLFVGTRREGKVYALVDKDQDHKVDKIYVLARGLYMPNGVVFDRGSLYVAEVDKVWRFDNIEQELDNPSKPTLVNGSFPDDAHHGWKFIAKGPDGKLYVPVGAPCNVCLKKDKRYASIMRMNMDGSNLEVYAHGVRNTVGFDWHPETNELWFTDNGRDWLGDNQPPDELNHAPRQGMHFGFPFYHGEDVVDPKYGHKGLGLKWTPPAQELGPHVAALGMRFYTGEMFPAEYRGDILIPEHGSWNRSTPIGYRVTRVKIANNQALSYEVFAKGWLQGRKAWGRPVDLLVLPDGSMLLSDDYADVIYRISYDGDS